VVLAFAGTAALKASGALELIRHAFPDAHVFGCTTAGEILGNAVRHGSVAVTALALDRARVVPAAVPIHSSERSFEAGQRLAQKFPASGLRHLFVVSDGLLVNGSELVDGLCGVLPPGVAVTGGLAGDGDHFQETYVWCDSDPRPAVVAALGFYGDSLRIGLSPSAGWDPFGPVRVVTKSRRNVLYELDGQPVLALYRRYLGEYATDFPVSGQSFPLEVLGEQGQDGVLRGLQAIDETEQSVTYAGNIPEGAHARLMFGSIEHLVAGAQAAGESAAAQLAGIAPQFSLLISCNGRRSVLGPQLDEEIEAVGAALGDRCYLAGFYSYGEIAPVRLGCRAQLLNQTMTVTSLAEV